MGVAAGAYSVGQQHAIEPAVNNAVTRPQRYATPVHNEVWEVVLSIDVYRFWISRGVTERLHDQIGRKPEAGQVFQFVPSHRPGGVLRTHSGHLGFAVGARTHAV